MKDKKVKIIATLGPATHTPESIFELAEAGVDVFRINLSHASEEEVKERILWVRVAEKKLGKPLAVLGDLAGPKIRIGQVAQNTMLITGETIQICSNEVEGNTNQLSLNHPEIIAKLKPGAEIYIDDGTIKLIAQGKNDKGVMAEIRVGGLLKSKKGFAAEGISLDIEEVLQKDKNSIQLLLTEKADAIAISFVQSEKDIIAVKKLIPKDKSIMLIAKIETASALEHIDAIIEEADGIMIARGDLGLAVPIAKVPYIQKDLISRAIKYAKPVITATQMLESMTTKPVPTRAEVADVANAILDGTDAVMLSAETAEGKFPLETVHTMVKIILESIHHVKEYMYHEESTVGNAVSSSAGVIADQIKAKLIIAFTESGITARRISRHKHRQPILALSPNMETVRRLTFSWGVYPYFDQKIHNLENVRNQAKEKVVNNPVCTLLKNELFVITAGMPFGEPGSTNFILIEKSP